MAIIEVNNITKVYPSRQGTRAIFGRGGILNWLRCRGTDTFPVLKDISLNIESGESLGIIGRNGSGKSTLLKILAGVTLPTSGDVTVRGRVASLLELGAGFHPMLSGRENVYLNAGLMGIRHAQVDDLFDLIVDFSGIREFIDQPVETYSSGMYVRLAFGVAVHVNPDVFLVDEVLSVGDEEFQRKCRRKIGELKEQGKTIVFVSHDLGIVNTLCDRVILLKEGEMINRDTPQKTINFYLRQIGRATGIHTMHDGDIEAIFNHGNITLFRGQEEITVSPGVEVLINYMGSSHSSSSADWEVTKFTSTTCRAKGVMPRLPLSLSWAMKVSEQRFYLTVQIYQHKPLELESINIRFLTTIAFCAWYVDGNKWNAPELLPSNTEWHLFAFPEPDCRECIALSEDLGDNVPSIELQLTSSSPELAMSVANSDYVTGARVVQWYRRLASSKSNLTETSQEYGTLQIGLDSNLEAIQEKIRAWERPEEPVLKVDSLEIRPSKFGYLELYYEGTPLTSSIHAHTAVCIENLWSHSQALSWEVGPAEGNSLSMIGESMRFPLKQCWELQSVPNGVLWRVWCEILEGMNIQEYNISVALVAGYNRWATQHESGEFPPHDTGDEEWRHINRNYTHGTNVRASGPGLPTILLSSTSKEPAFHMSVVNTGARQNARVLQAIHSSGRDASLYFPRGRHLWFEGTINLD